ncbi:hypothetical protein PG996_002888 [Apiospora saccharicola]|uniref:F-box domain-containing protein n=1 Tax=Apiospora saccharicola TaxID=335842 RepID=A0ABR1WKT3_9PEZI
MLNQLSAELVVLIFDLLDDPSFLACRCVSRWLSRASYDLFAQRWFGVLTTDFTPRSLQRLTCISQNREIASRVRELDVARLEKPPHPTAIITSRKRTPGDDEDVDDDEESDDGFEGFGEPWPRCESGCLDLDSPQANELRGMFLRFAHCTEICIIDGGEEKLWSLQLAPDKLKPVDIFWFMLSLLKRDGENAAPAV